MSRVVLSLGSNLGDPIAQLRAAAVALRPWTLARSAVYATKPWGPVVQDDFLNAVIIAADPSADATTWLRRAQGLERVAGRTRDVASGPRTLDVDLIAVDDVDSVTSELVLPHPRAARRAFVLVPWLSVDDQAQLPGVGPVAALIEQLPAAEVDGVRLRADLDWSD